MGNINTGVWTPGQAYSMMAVRMTASLLTAIGSIFIIFSLFYFKKMGKLASRLIFWMALSSLVTACMNLINPLNYITVICWIQGMVMQFSQMSTFLWTCTIATNLFVVVVLKFDKKEVLALEKWYHIMVWTSAFVFWLVPLLTLNYGSAGLWCWITDRAWGAWWRFLCFYFPLYIFIVWIIFAYFAISFKIWYTFRGTAAAKKSKDFKIIRRLALYPIAFVIIWIFPIINRAQNWIDPQNPIFILYLLHAIFAPLQGFVNAVIYGLDKALMRQYINCCKGCCGMEVSEVKDEDDSDSMESRTVDESKA
eukprot:TRINITY_DN2512_c0_g2_i1.p1 TRINITY_DN2512_c0_g2~~TRINITY_DN2512_c0_g2_i1.p1  ORF type:complete len:357 (+),score=109.86 TRINITY_DN2512_c0_g2_i1:150-1073(+)